MSSLDHLLNKWRVEKTVAENITEWVTEAARSAQVAPFPAGLSPLLVDVLRRQGIPSLYVHQAQAIEAAGRGEHVAIATGTASGKTLAYNLPVISARLANPSVTALYLFPTKALAHDQFSVLEGLGKAVSEAHELATGQPFGVQAALYDGDTPAHHRSAIRKNARLLLTNPDMLHTGILPHHTLWADFFRSLRFVVVDEMHIYRGVFGSHVTNVIRRLKRIAAFYGSQPQFFLTSATIANPQQLAERMIEAPVTVIDQDGSPRGLRHFLLYNPPLVNFDLGIRRSAVAESVRLSSDLLDYNVQTLIFARTRRGTELALKNLKARASGKSDDLHGYRSGYLPEERRRIEQGLRSGEVRGVVATNALELGIDIGGIEAAVLIGYPGTIAATRQQSGRAGRKHQSSLSILVASANPLDQFLIQHPDYLHDSSPEKALINPDNPLILIQHLRCAAFELPFRRQESFGSLSWELLEEYLGVMAEGDEIVASGDRFYWSADRYPAEQISLRSASAQSVVLQIEAFGSQQTIGTVDEESAYWMVHPQAVYLHEGRSYLVEHLDLEQHRAELRPVEVDYYTETLQETDIEKLAEFRSQAVTGGSKVLGEILVTTQVAGFKRVNWETRVTLDTQALEMPPTHLRTVAYWLVIGPESVEQLQKLKLWQNSPNDYGPNWTALRILVRQRDRFTCQNCGAEETTQAHHVHHRVPFRAFTSPEQANSLDNLVTLCPSCHREAETSVRIRSGLAGLRYVLNQLAPLFVMCDVSDLGSACDPLSALSNGQPTVVIYDQVPAGIGLAESLFDNHAELLQSAFDLVSHCACQDGCPSCVGAGGENGSGGKLETLGLLAVLTGNKVQ